MTTVSRLIVKDLGVNAVIGVHPWEQAIKQRVVIDLSLEIDISLAAESDQLVDALDYATLAVYIEEIILSRAYQLLETMLMAVYNGLTERYPQIKSGHLVLHKPRAIAHAADVAFEIHWPIRVT